VANIPHMSGAMQLAMLDPCLRRHGAAPSTVAGGISWWTVQQYRTSRVMHKWLAASDTWW
jgi:hypothetical protein